MGLINTLGLTSASVTYGPYARLEVGRAGMASNNAYWHPPGFPRDPEISFSLNANNVKAGSVAFGFDWQNGWRADLGFFNTGISSFSGQCVGASDNSACDDPVTGHADISQGSVKTSAVMANVFFAPLEARGSNSVFQPFVTAGLGVARNEVGNWTRENPRAGSRFRTFAGDAHTDLAWSVGVGAALQVTPPGQWPIILETSWKYYNFGEAKGGTMPLSGGKPPVTPLSFNATGHMVSIGVRIPLQRY